MNADDIPIANKDSLNQEDCSKQENKGDSYSQNGNHGNGHMSGGEIKDNAKVAGKIDENNHNQSQNTNIQFIVNTSPSTQFNISETSLNSNPNKILFEIKLSGELTEDNKAKYKDIKREIEDIVEKLSDLGIKHSLTTKYVKEGSIKIGLEGHPEDFKKLQELFKSGQLSEILGIPVEDFSLVVTENLDNSEEIKNEEKSRLVKGIKTGRAFYRNLIGAYLNRAYLSILADLIGAYLNRAYLSGASLSLANLNRAYLSILADLIGAYLNRANLNRANLNRADLRGASLSEADLSEADLSEADLSEADLSGADLSGADLSGADLNRADLSRANLDNAEVNNARFGYNKGIDESMKDELIKRGAIFEDSPGDRSGF